MNNRNQQLQREQYSRTKAEQILDKQLFKKPQSLHALEQQIYGAQNKQPKIEQQSQLTCQQALQQIIPFLNNDNKSHIALSKIKKIFAQFQEKLYPLHILQIFYLISMLKFKLKQHECNQLVEDIVQQCKIGKFQPIQQILNLQLNISIKLQTDDTYQFNDTLKQLKVQIDSLQNNTENFQIIDIKEENKNEQIEHYEYDLDTNFVNIMNDKEAQLQLKQQYLINCLEILVDQFKFQWAKTSIHTFIQNLNFNQKKYFQVEFQKQIDDIVSKIQNAKILHNANIERDEAKNAKLMQDYLKPIHEVSDCRAVINTSDGLDQWHLKQSGL